MKPIKTISSVGGSIHLYPNKLIIEEGGCLVPKRTTTMPFQEIKRVSAFSERLHVKSTHKTCKLWFGSENDWQARKAARDINKLIQESNVALHPDYKAGDSCLAQLFGLIVFLLIISVFIYIGFVMQ